MYTINLTTGVVTRNTDSKQVAPAQSIEDPDYVEYVNWVNQGNMPIEYTTPIVETRRLTKLAFRSRFTTNEKIALEFASLDNPNASIEARQLSAALRVYLKDMESAQFVDLAREDVIQGVQQLTALGILTAERAEAILNAPIQPHEVI